ncbi:hypothetical protein PRIPAC_93021 [Pristionchus pacificus]|uniref:Uncharacterized protein n=1 Tax=Pristionchus pacificus TaxID=54126 RepID=A0A2A6BAI0_PRIPA|nr:hypothetical protein PRIPAC_93021 [Pristionchus pacificus]|eukprot:PDM62874.1 hypothetical protein PRIPAC_50089 [Pristionchus pacificus]
MVDTCEGMHGVLRREALTITARSSKKSASHRNVADCEQRFNSNPAIGNIRISCSACTSAPRASDSRRRLRAIRDQRPKIRDQRSKIKDQTSERRDGAHDEIAQQPRQRVQQQHGAAHEQERARSLGEDQRSKIMLTVDDETRHWERGSSADRVERGRGPCSDCLRARVRLSICGPQLDRLLDVTSPHGRTMRGHWLLCEGTHALYQSIIEKATVVLADFKRSHTLESSTSHKLPSSLIPTCGICLIPS